MPRVIKTPFEKLQTKVRHLISDDSSLVNDNSQVSNDWRVLFTYSEESIKYTKTRYYPTKIIHFDEEQHEVILPLTNENLKLLSSNISNPPTWVRVIVDLFNRSAQ